MLIALYFLLAIHGIADASPTYKPPENHCIAHILTYKSSPNCGISDITNLQIINKLWDSKHLHPTYRQQSMVYTHINQQVISKLYYSRHLKLQIIRKLWWCSKIWTYKSSAYWSIADISHLQITYNRNPPQALCHTADIFCRCITTWLNHSKMANYTQSSL